MFGVCLGQKMRKQSSPHGTAVAESKGTGKHHVLLLKKENNSISNYIYFILLRSSCSSMTWNRCSASSQKQLCLQIHTLVLWESAPNEMGPECSHRGVPGPAVPAGGTGAGGDAWGDGTAQTAVGLRREMRQDEMAARAKGEPNGWCASHLSAVST